MPKLQFDPERYCRHNVGRTGTWQGEDIATLIADEVHRLRMAVDLGEQGAVHMREEVRNLRDAFAWERECEELHGIITELYCNVSESAPEEDEISRTYFAARAEVDRMIADCKGEG